MLIRWTYREINYRFIDENSVTAGVKKTAADIMVLKL